MKDKFKGALQWVNLDVIFIATLHKWRLGAHVYWRKDEAPRFDLYGTGNKCYPIFMVTKVNYLDRVALEIHISRLNAGIAFHQKKGTP